MLFPATWAAQQSAAEVAEIVEEDVTGVRVVKGFGQEDRELGRLREGARRLFANRMRAVRLTAKISPALQAPHRAGPGRGARARRVPGTDRQHLAGHLPGLHAVPRAVGGADPDADPAAGARPAGQGIGGAGTGDHRFAAGDHRAGRSAAVAGRAARRCEFAGVRFGYSPEDPVLRRFDLHGAAGVDGGAGRRVRVGQIDRIAAAAALLRPAAGRRSGRRARRPGPGDERPAQRRGGGVRGGVPVLRLASPPTSATAARTRPTPRSGPPRSAPRPRTSSRRCRTATTR